MFLRNKFKSEKIKWKIKLLLNQIFRSFWIACISSIITVSVIFLNHYMICILFEASCLSVARVRIFLSFESTIFVLKTFIEPILSSVLYSISNLFFDKNYFRLQDFRTGAMARMSAIFLNDTSESKLTDSDKSKCFRVLKTPQSIIVVKSFSSKLNDIQLSLKMKTYRHDTCLLIISSSI